MMEFHELAILIGITRLSQALVSVAYSTFQVSPWKVESFLAFMESMFCVSAPHPKLFSVTLDSCLLVTYGSYIS